MTSARTRALLGRRMDTAPLLDCLATAYRLDLDAASYVRHLAQAAAPMLDCGLGVMAYTYDARGEGPPQIDHFALSERFDPSWLPPFYAALSAAKVDVGSPERPAGFRFWGHLTCGQASAIPEMREMLPIFSHIGGARDSFAVNARDASGRGLWIGAPLPTTQRVSATRMALFERFAAHLTAAVRVRRIAGPSKPKAAAVLSPRGELLHAETDTEVRARDDLRQATVDFDHARSKEMRDDAERATRRWRPLVGSRWSLLDHFDTDGRRFVIAVENGPPTRPPRKDLSEREHQVLTQAHLGHSDKVIAYELGLAPSTVRVLLYRAAVKLGAASREELLARFDALAQAPPGDS